MADLGYLSRKIDGAIDKILCENFDKRAVTLPAGRYVSLCFDDFPQSAAQTAAPMIERRDWRATWYVAGGFMGETEPEYGQMFTSEDLHALRRNGHDFGCHTFDHIDCSTASTEELQAQVRKSAAFLAANGLSDVSSFAFPFGAVDLAAKRVMSQTGLALRGVKPGTNRGSIDLNMLKACGLQENEGRTARALEELETLKHQDGWLIIFTHDVRETPSPWGVTPQDYEHLLDAVARSDAEIVTMGDMMNRLNASDTRDVRAVA